ncbi:DUF1490 family protein [Williamsia sp.]|uniref:DUF1490 family protein n=1 Tax=Williamsia sp. TaxID=1872085 RepID=UPI001A1CF990|nr:DUF1490 family protein [Williamsia sp.]MBJ7288770.1 DUF1490 family protein [Williamsia sp.]
MPVHGLIAKATTTVVTGAVGAVAYDLARKAAARAPIRDAAVVVTSWGLRGTRRAEESAESARLAVADVVAEARERIGEETTPPGTADAGHSHDH